MKKILHYLAAVIVLTSHTAMCDFLDVEETDRWTPLQLGLFSAVGLPYGTYDVYGGSFSVVGQLCDEVVGVAAGGFFCSCNEVWGLNMAFFESRAVTMKGLQIAPIWARASRMYGVQAGLFCVSTDDGWHEQYRLGNTSYGNSLPEPVEDLVGIQIAGFLNDAEHVVGVQAGTYNKVYSSLRGAQLGLANYCKDDDGAYGLQVSICNIAKDMRGVQIGVINICDDLAGFQVGAVNIVTKSKVKFMPVFNCRF